MLSTRTPTQYTITTLVADAATGKPNGRRYLAVAIRAMRMMGHSHAAITQRLAVAHGVFMGNRITRVTLPVLNTLAEYPAPRGWDAV